MVLYDWNRIRSVHLHLLLQAPVPQELKLECRNRIRSVLCKCPDPEELPKAEEAPAALQRAVLMEKPELRCWRKEWRPVTTLPLSTSPHGSPPQTPQEKPPKKNTRRRRCCSAADGGTETGAALIKETMTSYIESSPSPSAQLSISTDASGEAPSEDYGALLKSEEIKVETLEFRESCSSQPTSSGPPNNNSSHRRAQRSTGKERKYHCSECVPCNTLLKMFAKLEDKIALVPQPAP
ncbi:hypothetical protein MHYP_G00119960 [Metynnis hypsauchen]